MASWRGENNRKRENRSENGENNGEIMKENENERKAKIMAYRNESVIMA